MRFTLSANAIHMAIYTSACGYSLCWVLQDRENSTARLQYPQLTWVSSRSVSKRVDVTYKIETVNKFHLAQLTFTIDKSTPDHNQAG